MGANPSSSFLGALRRQWWLALLAVAACAVTTVLWLRNQPDTYSTTAVVSVGPRTDRALVSASMIKLLATRYVAYASSAQLADTVAQDLGLDPVTLQSALEVTMPELTTNVYVSLELDDPEDAAAAAAAYTEAIVENSTTDPVLSAAVLVPARIDMTPDPAASPRLLAAAAVVALLLGGTVAIVADQLGRHRPHGAATDRPWGR
jgi:capsular polysaccharide biosynthesis protein